MNSAKISIVIPVYNSAASLQQLVTELTQTLHNKLDYELLLINDGSKDNSWEEIREISKGQPELIGINLRKNCGQDNAIMAGLGMTTGLYCVIMDDDLQHDPAIIFDLLSEMQHGADVCYANFEHREQTAYKRSGSDLNGKVAQVLVNKPKHIYLSPFKIIHRAVVDEILRYSGPYPYIDGILLNITDKISQVPATHRKRLAGKSTYGLRNSLSVFLKLFTGFSIVPLRIATYSGLVATFIGGLLGLKYLYDYFIAKNYIEGWTTVVLLILIFGGLILTSLGIVGEYIGRMYLTMNNKPQYSISEIIRSKRHEE